MSTALEQKQAQRIAYLEKREAEREHLLQNQGKEITFLRNETRWRNELLANTALSPAHKLLCMILRDYQRTHQGQADEQGLIPLFMPVIAALLALSPKIVGARIQELATAGLVERKMVGTSDGKDYKKRVFISTGETLRIRPAEAKLTEARNHGGKREKRPTCPDCGSPNVTDSHHHTCRSCGVDRIISTKEYSGVEDIPEPHPTFEELPTPVRPALALVPVCVTEEPDEEIDPYDEPVEAQKKDATCKHVPIVHPDSPQVATPPAKSPLLPMEPVARVCHICGNANRLLWEYNTLRNKWECLVCYHYSDEYEQITS